jgi:hypothetical protein
VSGGTLLPKQDAAPSDHDDKHEASPAPDSEHQAASTLEKFNVASLTDRSSSSNQRSPSPRHVSFLGNSGRPPSQEHPYPNNRRSGSRHQRCAAHIEELVEKTAGHRHRSLKPVGNVRQVSPCVTSGTSTDYQFQFEKWLENYV